MRYRCRLCGEELPSLGEWYRHLLSRHPEEEPVVLLYEAFGDSMNCVVCPYKPLGKMRRYRLAEDARILRRFAEVALRSERWKRYFSGLLDGSLELEA
jgi:hypothetical protein